ncbi:hypothetical protein HU200_060340 [Digitaria exilis]|uniref:Reverse transcriptase zinc-binding domain-containing protein n=1 Tax=Digitaria exilis TaxID=1010633 RepID=A0A835AJF1_9POAL|nr:hypothetical protein HU200_060340 [Digitaria exilis]
MSGLYSHNIKPDFFVHEATTSRLAAQLRLRLTRVATEELTVLEELLSHFNPEGGLDHHFLTHRPDKAFSSKEALAAFHGSQSANQLASSIWETHLSNKVKFFGWLLYHGHVNSRAMLHSRHIRSIEDSFCEHCPETLETDEHIFTQCPTAISIWGCLGIDANASNFRYPAHLGQELEIPHQVQTDVMLLLLWHIWKARNAMLFEHKDQTTTETIRRVIVDMEAWQMRYRRLNLYWQAWRDFLLSRL